MKKILITGCAGFIGYHLAKRLLAQGFAVKGIDNLNDYYDVNLKFNRLEQLLKYPDFEFVQGDLADERAVAAFFGDHLGPVVVHLAAQAGVRYSLKNPGAYAQSNLVGFTNILEACRHHDVKHLIYASSSSVYGGNQKLPFSESDAVDHPVSLYAATKKANELMAHTYSHLYQLPTTGLRFFTVYGPWGRPDMAYFSFARDMVEGRPIQVFNHGQMMRDFTYIDDIVEGIVRLLERPAAPFGADALVDASGSATAPYRIYNIGNHQPVALLEFIELLEKHLGVAAKKVMLPMQPGDVAATYADISRLREAVGFAPSTSLDVGLGRFVAWFRGYYG